MRVDAGGGTGATEVAALVRGAAAASVVVVIRPGLSPLDEAMLTAAIGPLAVERAPAGRVNAVLVRPDASEAAVEAAAGFLETAASTTGQVLAVG